MFNGADTNGDKLLDFTEFYVLLSGTRSRSRICMSHWNHHHRRIHARFAPVDQVPRLRISSRMQRQFLHSRLRTRTYELTRIWMRNRQPRCVCVCVCVCVYVHTCVCMCMRTTLAHNICSILQLPTFEIGNNAPAQAVPLPITPTGSAEQAAPAGLPVYAPGTSTLSDLLYVVVWAVGLSFVVSVSTLPLCLIDLALTRV